MRGDYKGAFVGREQTDRRLWSIQTWKESVAKRGQQEKISSDVVVVVPYVPSGVARCRVMREGGMILIILSPTVQLGYRR